MNPLCRKIEDDKVFAIFVTLIENCSHLADMYAQASERSVTSTDMIYALRHQCMHLFEDPDLVEKIEENRTQNEELSSSESSIGSTDDNEASFTRADNDHALAAGMNESYDTWDDWVPNNAIQRFIKDIIDKVT